MANLLSGTVSVLFNLPVSPNYSQDLFQYTAYIAGGRPNSVFSADLEGDGDNDVAVANWLDGSVSVLLNHGDGTFADKVEYGVGSFPTSVFGADLDGDGDNDLVVANSASKSVSVLLNYGDGTFAPKMDYGAGSRPRSVFSTDLDGDGDNDLVTANPFSRNVSVLLNNGNGTFVYRVYAVGAVPFSVFAADLDGDGDNDLAVTNRNSGTVSVLMNNGDGVFAPKVDYAAGRHPKSVYISDLDGDGDNDLAVANGRGNTVSVLLNVLAPAITEEEEPSSNVPKIYCLSQNYPNPFNLRTVIQYYVSLQSHINICIYNIMGQKVAILLDREIDVGEHSIVWDGIDDSGKSLASGVYVYRMKADKFVHNRKLSLMR